MTNNGITDDGLSEISSESALTAAILSENEISDRGAHCFAAHKTLEHVGLYLNEIGDEGAKAFTNNHHITTLLQFDYSERILATI